MLPINKKQHWENVYATKQPNEVSWTQEIPKTSLDFIHEFNLPKSASIIDVGGGDGKLVDYLLAEGFQNITVLDISETAINKAKLRLGTKASQVKWIISDITEFIPETTYDCWHDRATFHFLTDHQEVTKYIETARKAVNGFLTIGTFSDKGPEKCSMLNVHKYSKESLEKELSNGFEKIRCIEEDHATPFNTTQNFVFCSFKKCVA